MQKRNKPRYIRFDGLNIAVDVRLDIYINNNFYTTLYLSPEYLEEALIGLLLSDGIIKDMNEIVKMEVKGNRADIYLDGNISLKPVNYDDCAANLEYDIPPIKSGITIEWDDIRMLYSRFNKVTASVNFSVAMHTTAIYQVDGEKEIIVHDVSRHNSVLKIIGLGVKDGIDFRKSMVFTTGRVSSDMVVRLARFGTPIIVSMRGALYSGLEAADKYGVTLISNIRKNGKRTLTILTHKHRILNP